MAKVTGEHVIDPFMDNSHVSLQTIIRIRFTTQRTQISIFFNFIFTLPMLSGLMYFQVLPLLEGVTTDITRNHQAASVNLHVSLILANILIRFSTYFTNIFIQLFDLRSFSLFA